MLLLSVNHKRISIKSVRILIAFCLINIFQGHEYVVRSLIELGATVNAEDKTKQTPLHLAAYNGKSFRHLTHWTFPFSIKKFPIVYLGHGNVVRLLIQLGAKVDAEDENRATPLHKAAFKG